MLRIVIGVALATILMSSIVALRPGSAKLPNESERRFLSLDPSTAVQADTHRVLQTSIVTKDVVFDRNTGKFYASVPSRAGAMGNSIARIDPVTGNVEGFVFVGSEPGKLALSDDGHTLYVSLDGAAAIRRFDLTTQTAGAQFSLVEENFDGPFFVKDLAVAPGNPDVVAVSRKVLNISPDFKGVAIYDHGVKRPLTTPVHTGSDFISFSSSAATLYGCSTGGGGLQKMSVTSSGVTVAATTPFSAPGGDFEFENGLLYLPFGQVFNTSTSNLSGTFSLNSSGGLSLSQVEADASVGRTYFLTGSNAFSDTELRQLTIQAFDQSTFLPTGTLQIPSVAGQVTSLVRWGANGLAFGSTGGKFYIIQTTLVPSSEPVPSPTPTPSPSPTPTPTPTPTPLPGQLREVPITAKDIVIDPTGTIYASVPSSAGAGGNSITPIDPVTNSLGQPVFVGSEPNKLAISDNGQVMYVGLDGAKAIRRFDVPTRMPGAQFQVDQLGQNVAVDLAVAPGQPQTVAAVRGDNPNSSSSVAIYDDGVQRQNTISFGHTIDVIDFSASPQILYGHNNSNSEFGFRKMAAPSCGLSLLSVRGGLLSGAANFEIENGLAFATNGRLADPELGTLLGAYPVTDGVPIGPLPTAVIADPATNRVYFFMNDTSDFTPHTMLLRVYDMQTFLHIGTLALPNISGRPRSVVRWGTDGFAFRTSTDKVYLIQTSLISNQVQPFVPAPTPTPPTYTLRGQVSSSFALPLPPVTLQLSGAGTTQTNADGSFSFINLPLCTDFTVTPQPIENYTFSPTSRTITAANQNNPNQSTAFFNAVPKLISFPFLSVSTNESAGIVTLTVTRTGDISAAATVNYQSADGNASEKSDYSTAIGTLRFAPNQASKQLQIFLVDDVRSEPSETFTVTLSSPTGAFLGTTPMVPITIVDNDATNGTTNPSDNAQFFVRQHYRDFLNRDPDTAGLNFWVNEITSCGTDQQCIEIKRINVSAAFFLSIEFQETGYLAYRAYKTAYGDTSSPNVSGTVPIIRFKEFLADAQRIGEGVQVGVGNWMQQLEDNKNAYVLEFVQRQRFVDGYPITMTADEFVTKLDQNAGGVLSVSEKAQLVALLGATPQDVTKRGAVIRAVAENSGLRNAELNRAFVLLQYFGYLRRNADDPQDVNFGGWKFWLDKLDQFHGNFIDAEMVKAFIVSGEYRSRFGP